MEVLNKVSFKFLHTKKGIGLLELMLSLAIIAALIMLGTMYYSSVSNNQRVTLATNMIHDIYGAAKNYASQNNPASSSDVMKTLIDQGFLTNYYSTDPWGGAINVTMGASSSVPTVTISLFNVPPSGCQLLVGRLLATINTSKGSPEAVSPAKPEDCPTKISSSSGPVGRAISNRKNAVSVTYVLY